MKEPQQPPIYVRHQDAELVVPDDEVTVLTAPVAAERARFVRIDAESDIMVEVGRVTEPEVDDPVAGSVHVYADSTDYFYIPDGLGLPELAVKSVSGDAVIRVHWDAGKVDV